MSNCFQGSYGRLGLGDSSNQPQLKRVGIPTECGVKKVSSSKGSDGHTLALTADGRVYSWGDGKRLCCVFCYFKVSQASGCISWLRDLASKETVCFVSVKVK